MNIKLINETNNILNPIQQILHNRGIENFDQFFKHDWDLVQAPRSLAHISTAAQRIIKACEDKEAIAILVDPDADGLLASAILINYLRVVSRALNQDTPNIKYILHRGKIHGLDDSDVMRELRDTIKPTLLIIPDASGSKKQYGALNEIGIDIISLDHHHDMVESDLMNSHVIIVNNQQSTEYINKDLSGAGVVWQLCRELDYKLKLNFANHWLDLVAVALVSDVMSLQSNETRFLIHEGLKPDNINSLFLEQCIKDLAYSLGGDLTPTNVGFYIGPLFNAVLRIGTIEEKELLFKALLDDEAASLIKSGKRGHTSENVLLVEEALRQATNAKARQKRQQDKLTEVIDAVIAEDNMLGNRVLVIAIDDFNDEQRNLSGLVANKMISLYQRPCILLFNNGDGTYSGSLRAPDRIEAFANFKDQCVESGLCIYVSGHQAAAGISLVIENIKPFQDYFNNKYKDIDTEPTYYCDFIVNANNPVLEDIIISLAQYKHIWGHGIPEPMIAITNVKVGPGKFTLLSAQKNPTLKFSLPNNVAAIKFRSSKEEFDSLIIPYDKKDTQFYNCTLVGKCSVNEWKGTLTPQILVDEYEITGIEYDF